MDEVVGGLVAALVGGVAGYVSAFLTNIIERRKVIDESVRAIRTARYSHLWRKTSLLPKWPKAEDVTYRQLLMLSGELRDWYYGKVEAAEATEPSADGGSGPGPDAPGGMYLSTAARKRYGKLQDQLTMATAGRSDEDLDRSVSDPDYGAIFERASRLRTEMTGDLLSRRRTFMTR